MRGPFVVGLVLLLGGIGLSFGAYASYHDQHTGTPGAAKVSSCSGHDGRYETGVHCLGSWAVAGDIAFGNVDNAGRDDIGHTVKVRIHGKDHATIPNTRVSIILGLLGIPMLGLGAYLSLTSRSRSSRASINGPATS